MKELLERKNLPWIALGLGAVGRTAWTVLYLAATDEKGLLLRNHPLEWVLWLVTALTAALVLVSLRKEDKTGKYTRGFAPSVPAALAAALMALAVGLAAGFTGLGVTWLERATFGAGLLAAAALAVLAVLRYRGEKPSFLLYCLVCVYLALDMIGHYQVWSSDPQLLDYIFRLFAVVFLTLFAYQQAAFCLGLGKLRTLRAVGLLGIFSCMTAGSFMGVAGALWCGCELYSLEPVRIPEPPAEEEAEEEAP